MVFGALGFQNEANGAISNKQSQTMTKTKRKCAKPTRWQKKFLLGPEKIKRWGGAVEERKAADKQRGPASKATKNSKPAKWRKGLDHNGERRFLRCSGVWGGKGVWGNCNMNASGKGGKTGEKRAVQERHTPPRPQQPQKQEV